MKVYIDSEFRCHSSGDDTMTEVAVDFFDGKCDAFIDGYRYIPTGESWVSPEGDRFQGEMVAPWKPYSQLDTAQREYELALIADMQTALNTLGVTLDE